jgi:hypothetical protein
MRDLLTDLMHLAEGKDIDVTQVVEDARLRFHDELDG